MDMMVEAELFHIPGAMAGTLIVLSVLTKTVISVVQQMWIDTFTDKPYLTNITSCNATIEYGQIDPFFTFFVVDVLITVFLGVILLFICCPCFKLITKYETSYEKSQFAVVGASDTVAILCFIYASSGCRTPHYLQAIMLNLTIPVVFILRYVALKKRATCRKLLCAFLVLFAEFTLLIPVLFPMERNESIYPEYDNLDDHPNALWVLCFFFGVVPMALSSIYSEKSVKVIFPHRNRPTFINMVYFLFWSYFFSLLTLLCLFWTDCIPGFGMYNNIPQFAKGIWFNMKCFFGYEGCTGVVNIVSGVCVFLVFINRIVNVYILRYLEGANYLAVISSLSTPLLYIFLTLFDTTPLEWHPHAYLSTWLSIAALCIMIPAIYIYTTGAPEIVPRKEPLVYCVDNGMQTIGHHHRNGPQHQLSNSFVQCHNSDDTIETDDETARLLIESDPPPYNRVLYNAFQEREITSRSVSVGVGSPSHSTESLDVLASGDNAAIVNSQHEVISAGNEPCLVVDRLLHAHDSEGTGNGNDCYMDDESIENPTASNPFLIDLPAMAENTTDAEYKTDVENTTDAEYKTDVENTTDAENTTYARNNPFNGNTTYARYNPFNENTMYARNNPFNENTTNAARITAAENTTESEQKFDKIDTENKADSDNKTNGMFKTDNAGPRGDVNVNDFADGNSRTNWVNVADSLTNRLNGAGDVDSTGGVQIDDHADVNNSTVADFNDEMDSTDDGAQLDDFNGGFDSHDGTRLLTNIPVIVCSPSSNHCYINNLED